MVAVDQSEELAPDELPPPSGGASRLAGRSPGSTAKIAGGVVAVVGLLIWAIVEEKIRSTVITVVVAVLASAGLWVGANLLFNEVRSSWERFNAIAFGLLGALAGILIHGNELTLGSGGGFLPWLLGPIVGAAIGGGVGVALAVTEEPARRLQIGLAGGIVAGLLVGLLMREEYHPGLDPLATILYTLVLGGIGAGISVLRGRPPISGGLIGLAIGWLLGAWGGADLGDGSIATSLIAALIPAVLIGARLGMTNNLDYVGRLLLENRSRAVIFVGPAILFITVMLVIPAIRTAYLSLLDRDSVDFVFLENYGAVFTDRDSFDGSNWTNMFTSWPFLIGVVLLAIAVVLGMNARRVTGHFTELGSASSFPLIAGALLLSFGVFTALRGTLINNLWWVVVVTFASTALGLAIAVLADGRRGEKIAKSIIFMPMAISLVGASIIWRFVYVARDPSVEQTGVVNALWVSLGKLSTGSGLPTLIAAIIIAGALLLSGAALARSLTRKEYGAAAVPGVLTLLIGWLFVRFVGIIGGGVGGFQFEDDGTVQGETIFFVQDPPYNNFWLMVVFIWIQTGFAMVILSAAIKAVPDELIEAAKIDGATETQVFWRVTLPQIASTIGVVVTTTIVGVMKVFDIVKVMTNGQFGTQVLANDMFQEAFSFNDTGKGAALAILIFVSVLPIMVANIRRMQAEG
ncbi:MAG: sugar ABC transporter permease [Actinomycetota bacterium]